MKIVNYIKSVYALLQFIFLKQFYSLRKDHRAIYRHFRRGEYQLVQKLFKKSGSTIKSGRLLPLIAFSYSKLGDSDAEIIMKRYLEFIFGKSIHTIIKSVEKQIFGCHDNVSTEYKYFKGMNNAGILEHQVDSGALRSKYISKITTTGCTAISKIQKEKYFYDNIRCEFPSLEVLTPERINFMCIKKRPKIFCATYEKIDGHIPDLCDIDQVIALSNKISSIDTAKTKDFLLKHPTGVPRLVPHMHLGITYKINHYRMLSHLKILCDATEVRKIVNTMQKIFIKDKLYQYLQKEEHFTFNHLDFHYNNILINPDTDKSYVVDWEKYGLAPFGTAMANYFFSINASFDTIYNTYLKFMPDFKGKDSDILSAIFVYRLLLSHIARLNNKNCVQVLEKILQPAAAYLEKLALEITNQ